MATVSGRYDGVKKKKAKRRMYKIEELPVKYDEIPISQKAEVRALYATVQLGNCYYCGEALTKEPRKDIADKKVSKVLFPDNFFSHPVHLDHDHDTGMTRGAVHCHCNAVLWEYEGK